MGLKELVFLPSFGVLEGIIDAGFRRMAAKYFKRSILSLLVIFSLLLDSDAVQGWGRLSKEEDLELDRQLKLINKPAIKTFQTEDGDIVDCVDIYKQLAFDHPLLKNHTIQMKPKTIPKGMKDEASTADSFSKYMPNNISCPQGSVPIKRTTKEELIIAKYLKSLGRNYPTDSHYSFTSTIDRPGYHFASLEYRGSTFGARARINIWNPTVTANQFSTASLRIVTGTGEQSNSIQAGWGVNQFLDKQNTKLYTYWTADGYRKTGCFNVLCPGFVQVSPNLTLGLTLQPSTYNGPQSDMVVNIHQDVATGDWWFMFQDTYIGYWPKTIFTSLDEGASFISWGGEVYSPIYEESPAMGSGHFPEEDYGKSAYISQIQIIDDDNAFVDPYDRLLKLFVDKPYCYNAILNVRKDAWGHYIYFGGPGNCTF